MIRRDFLKLIGVSATGSALSLPLFAAPTPYNLLEKDTLVLRIRTDIQTLYSKLPCIKEIADEALTYYSINNLTIKAEKEFLFHDVYVQVPQFVRDAFAEMGMKKEWTCCATPRNNTVFEIGDTLTFEFGSRGVLSIG